MALFDIFDYFGSTYAKEESGDITVAGIDTARLLSDINDIWRNVRVPNNMFKQVRRYRIVFDSFFAPDVLYQLEEIMEFRKRRSHKFRLKTAHEQLLTNTWLTSTIETHPDILDFSQLDQLKFKLLPTQLETLQVYNQKVPRMQLKGFLMGTPPGSGKTLMSIALSICLHSDVAIFVVPKATVMSVWYDGIIEQFGDRYTIWDSVQNSGAPTTDFDYYIFHYEALEKAVEFAKRLKLVKNRPFIAIDESHNLNEITSQRTQRLIEVAKILDCQHTVFATGTPVKALGLEMVPLLRTIDRYFTPDAEARFMRIYGATAKRANDILRNRLGLISHKIIESDYMKIPPPIERDHFVTLPDPEPFLIATIKEEMQQFMRERHQFYQSHMREYIRIYEDGLRMHERTLKSSSDWAAYKNYKTYVRTIIEGYDPKAHAQIANYVKNYETQKLLPSLPPEMRNKVKEVLSVVKYVKLKVLGEALGWLGKKRSECAVALATHGKLETIVLSADKKTIIFSSFIPALVAANTYFENLGFKTLQVHGDFTKNIPQIVGQFKTDPDANPLLATLQSLAASQTLTVANVVVFIDAPFREYIRNQAFHRIFRIGQNVQTYIYMVKLNTGTRPNISDRSADILEWSQEQVSQIFGSATRDEALGIVRQLKLNPPNGLDTLLDMMKKVYPF